MRRMLHAHVACDDVEDDLTLGQVRMVFRMDLYGHSSYRGIMSNAVSEHRMDFESPALLLQQ